MTRPLIGLTAYREPARWNVWDAVPAALLPWTYVQRVTDAGGAAVLLPPEQASVDDVMRHVDGLLLTGGPDVDPRRYGARPGPHTQHPRQSRDAYELAALEIAERRGLPVLAICRGAQLLNVARGGTLHQHLPEHAPTVEGQYDSRAIQVAPDSRLGAALGGSVTLLCAHHQGVDRLGDGLVVTARAEDGVVEGIEDPTRRFLVGVQSHPEEDPDTRALFAAFVEAATTAG